MNITKYALLIGTTLICASSTATAATITYDFDSIVSNTYTEANFSSMFEYVSFDNTGGNSFTVQACNLPADFTCGNAVFNSPYDTTANSTIATFDYFVNFASITLGDYGGDSDTLFLHAYNSINNLVATDSYSSPASTSVGYTLSVSASDIAYIQFFGIGSNNNSVYWDNLSFTIEDVAVPEPSTYILFGIGLAAFTVTTRRRLKVTKTKTRDYKERNRVREQLYLN